MSWTLRQDLELFGIHLPQKFALDDWVTRVRDKPCTNTAAVVALSGYLFYRLERGHNPKVQDIYDAMIYTSTCLSVGYGNIFACTPAGKLLGTILMTLGPALAAKTLDGSPKGRVESEAVQVEILATLKQILATLDQPLAEAGRQEIP